jgi:hypothetical protein
MRSNEVPVGSFLFWITWKLGSIFVLVFVTSVVLSSTEFKEPMRFGFLFILIGILVVSNEDLVYGHAMEQGVHFRRYFKEQVLPWEAISCVKWSSSNVVEFQLKGHSLFRKKLSAQSFGSEPASEWLSTPPDIVRWLLVTKPSGADGIELVGPGQ